MIEWSRGKFSSLSRASLNQPPVHTSTHSAVSVCTYEFEFCFLEPRQSRILRRGWPAENNNRKKQPQKWLPNREDMMTGWRWRDVWSFFSPDAYVLFKFLWAFDGYFYCFVFNRIIHLSADITPHCNLTFYFRFAAGDDQFPYFCYTVGLPEITRRPSRFPVARRLHTWHVTRAYRVT